MEFALDCRSGFFYGHKKSSDFHQSSSFVVGNLELSNLLEDFYKVVDLYDYLYV